MDWLYVIPVIYVFSYYWSSTCLNMFLDVCNFCSSHHIPPHQIKTDLFADINDTVNFNHINVIFGGWFFLQNNIPASAMTRRNTYVCTDRSNADRHSLLQNGKENRWEKCVCMCVCVCLYLTFTVRVITKCTHETSTISNDLKPSSLVRKFESHLVVLEVICTSK